MDVRQSPSPSVFFFNVPAPTEIYTLSLHDALPISGRQNSLLCAIPVRCGIEIVIDSAARRPDRKGTRLNSSHTVISYAVFCLKKKKMFASLEQHEQLQRSIEHSVPHPIHCAPERSR